MEYVVLKGFRVDGYAALEVGEVGILPYEADRIADLVAGGYLAPVTEEPPPVVVEPGEVAVQRPHFIGQGEPPPGTWEAVWQEERSSAPLAEKKSRKAPAEEG